MIDLSGFYGSEHLYFHPLFKGINYTDGVQYLNKVCGWIVTDILSVLKFKVTGAEFVAITFKKNGKGGSVVYDDGNGKVLYKQVYEIADIDLDEVKFFFTDGVLMLASEY